MSFVRSWSTTNAILVITVILEINRQVPLPPRSKNPEKAEIALPLAGRS